jgi:hypothetical protein
MKVSELIRGATESNMDAEVQVTAEGFVFGQSVKLNLAVERLSAKGKVFTVECIDADLVRKAEAPPETKDNGKKAKSDSPI